MKAAHRNHDEAGPGKGTMSNTAGSNGARREPSLADLEAELARLKQLQKDIQKIGSSISLVEALK